jgi:hypothetical protein
LPQTGADSSTANFCMQDRNVEALPSRAGVTDAGNVASKIPGIY